MNYIAIGGMTMAVLVIVLMLVFTITRLYKRATPSRAFVVTGMGNEKVIMGGGTVVIPIVQGTTDVNLETITIRVERRGENGVITADSNRADIETTFTIRVGNTVENIKTAANRLGNKTFDRDALSEIITPQVDAAVRSISAGMTLDELNSKRSDFEVSIGEALRDDLAKLGLVMDSVSITHFDQTNLAGLNENNVFNAAAMANVAAKVNKSREERAKLTADADIRVAEENSRAKTRIVEQERDLARARSESEAHEATAREQAARDIEIARQDREIAIQGKSREEVLARAESDRAREKAVEAEQAIVTANAVAEAERDQRIKVIQTQTQAESEATRQRIAADVEAKTKRIAAEVEAETKRISAEVESETKRIAAEAVAKEIKIKAEAEREAAENRAQMIRVEAEARAESILKVGEAEAEAKKKLAEAENALSPEARAHRESLEKIAVMPQIIQSMMLPAEKIDSIRILQGMPNLVGGAGGAEGTGQESLSDVVTNVALRGPMAKMVGDMLGVHLSDGITGFVSKEIGGVAGQPLRKHAPQADDFEGSAEAEVKKPRRRGQE